MKKSNSASIGLIVHLTSNFSRLKCRSLTENGFYRIILLNRFFFLQEGSERYTVLITVIRPIPFFNRISAVIAEIKLHNIHFEKITNAGHCLKKC